MSHLRIDQVRQLVDEYFEIADPETDALFQLHLPLLVRQQQIDVDLADPACAKASWMILQ